MHNDLKSLAYQGRLTKESAWRDLPYLARGVMSNLRENTLPDLKRAADAQRVLDADPEYFNSEQPLRERARRVADIMQGTRLGDARQNEAVARLLRMYRAAGKDSDAHMYYLWRNRVEKAKDSASNVDAAEQVARLRTRAEHARRAVMAEGDIEKAVLNGDVSPIVRTRAREPSGGLMRATERLMDSLHTTHPLDDDFMQRMGAKPVPQIIGKRIEPLVENPHYVTRGLRPIVIGTPGRSVPSVADSGAAISNLLAAGTIARSQPVLAHELGHATGLGSFLTMPLSALGSLTRIHALKLPEEFRAQMRGQDIMRSWHDRGVASDLPAELSTMTPEQLKEHTLPLSTYTDAAARQVFNATLNARDMASRVRAWLGRAGNRRDA